MYINVNLYSQEEVYKVLKKKINKKNPHQPLLQDIAVMLRTFKDNIFKT